MKLYKKVVYLIMVLILVGVIGDAVFLNFPLKVNVSEEKIKVTKEGSVLIGQEKVKHGDIPVVTLKGSPYQMGYQHGRLLSSEIKSTLSVLKDILDYSSTLKGLIRRNYVRYIALKYYNNIDNKYKQELKGIADGAGVSFYDVLLINIYDEIFNITGCTNIAVWGKYTQNGVIIHGRNLDYDYQKKLFDKQVLLYYQPQDDYQFISVGFPGYIGVLTGMNEKGISLGSMTSYAVENSLNGIPSGILYRRIIENSENIEDVEQILKNNSRTIGNNLMITSKNDGYGVVFEISAERVIIRRPDQGRKTIAATNHFNILENEKVLANSKHREKRAKELPDEIKRQIPLEARGNFKIGHKDVINMLNDRLVGYGNGKRYNPIGNHLNLQSVVFIPENMEFWVSANDTIPAAGGCFWQFKIDPVNRKLLFDGNTEVSHEYLIDQQGLHRNNDYWNKENTRKVLDRYRAKNLDKYYLMYRTAWFYANTARYSKAIELYNQLLNEIDDGMSIQFSRNRWIDLNYYRIYYYMAKAYDDLGKRDKALQLLNKALDQPNIPEYFIRTVEGYMDSIN